jgi:hypothetical protein
VTTVATVQIECIYCRSITSGAEGEAHVFPEAIVANVMTLPPGTVCDKCNHYCGHELDSAVVRFPFIAMVIQLLALPGKKGKPRKELGRIERLPNENTIRFDIQEPIIERNSDGSRSAVVECFGLHAGTYRSERIARGSLGALPTLPGNDL